jgi:hypothetical protein
MNAGKDVVGRSGAAPARNEGGPAPKTGARETLEFVNAEKLVKAAIEKRLALVPTISNDRVKRLVEYAMGIAGAGLDDDTVDTDVINALTIVRDLVQDMKQLVNHQINGARFLVEYFRYMGLSVEVRE